MTYPYKVVLKAPSYWKYLFWSRVNVGPVSDCWTWRESLNRDDGYGTLQAPSGGAKLLAHRVAYALHTRSNIEGDHILHRCDNPPCCNPYHLVAGDHASNMLDMSVKGRAAGWPPRKGESHPRAKLTQAQVDEIRVLLAQGVRNTEIAKLFGVAQNNISRIKTGAQWRTVTQ